MRTRFWVAIALIAPVAAFSLLGTGPRGSRSGPAPVPVFPDRVGSWEGRDVAPAPRTLELLGTDRVVQRTYRSDRGDEVLLCIVYASGGDRSIHPPEVCYRGWGFEITDRGRVDVPGSPDPGETIEASLLELSREGSRRVSLFWYQGSAGAGTGWLRQRIRGLLAPLRGGSSEWALIRVSSPIPAGGTREATIDRIREFLREFTPHLALPAGP